MRNRLPLKEYLATLNERKKTSKVYTPYQMLGLELAEILEDEKHKSLYIKLAKTRDNRTLIELAKDIAARKNIKNKGAYFMRMIQTRDKQGK